jgi:gliding motility-associated-like protein
MRVIVYPKPKAVAKFPGVKQLCAGDSFTLKAVTAPGLEYQWVRNNRFLNVFSRRDSILKTGLSGTYYLVVRNIGATCTDTSLKDSLTIFPRFIPRILGTKRFCKDSTTQLSVSPVNAGYAYQWQYNGVNVPDSIATTFTIGKTGTVRVILKTDFGCRDSSLVTLIDSLPIPFTGALFDTSICEGGIATFRTVPDTFFTYRWTDSSTRLVVSVKEFLSTSKPGKYYLDVSNACKVARDSVNLVRVYPLPRFGILDNGRKDTLICVDDQKNDLVIRLFAPPGYKSYNWRADTIGTGQSRQFILPNSDLGDYKLFLSLTDEFGCSNSDTVTVRVVDCPPVVFIPNAFSPNNDGTNDFWNLTGYDIENIKIYVYNRWGQQIYFSEKIYDTVGWDGTFNGSVCPSGTYKYVVEYEGLAAGSKISKRETGTLTILK